MAGIFEHDLAFDESARVASRKAAAVAHKRASDRFSAFLANASGDDFHQRFALIEEEVAEIAQDVADEYGADEHQLLASLTSVLAAGGFCDDCRKWKSGPKAGCECGSENESSPDTTDTGSSDEEESSEAKEARTARWVVSEFPGDQFADASDDPRGSTPGNFHGFDLNDYDQGQGPDVKRLVNAVKEHALQHYNEGGWDYIVESYEDPEIAELIAGATTPEEAIAKAGEAVGARADVRDDVRGYGDVDAEEGFRGHEGLGGYSHTRQAEALETESLPTGDDTALDGPSPKIDKKEWKPNALNEDGNLSPIDTEGSGSPHPTVQQDVTDVADHTADPLAQTDAVTESQDVGKETTTEAIHTDTWSGKGGQADPVTSAAQDVERNPLREMIRSGIIPRTQVEAAIAQHENR